MKKGTIIAFVAAATSFAVYAGVNNQATAQAKSECCDPSTCCPDGTITDECCECSCN